MLQNATPVRGLRSLTVKHPEEVGTKLTGTKLPASCELIRVKLLLEQVAEQASPRRASTIPLQYKEDMNTIKVQGNLILVLEQVAY